MLALLLPAHTILQSTMHADKPWPHNSKPLVTCLKALYSMPEEDLCCLSHYDTAVNRFLVCFAFVSSSSVAKWMHPKRRRPGELYGIARQLNSLQVLEMLDEAQEAKGPIRDHRPLCLNLDDHTRVCRVKKAKGHNFRSLPGVVSHPDGALESWLLRQPTAPVCT